MWEAISCIPASKLVVVIGMQSILASTTRPAVQTQPPPASGLSRTTKLLIVGPVTTFWQGGSQSWSCYAQPSVERSLMTPWLHVALIGAAALLAFDALASVGSHLTGFPYTGAIIGSWIVYGATGFAAARTAPDSPIKAAALRWGGRSPGRSGRGAYWED